MSVERITLNTILGTQPDGGIVILESLFAFGDGLKGATGAVVYPVTADQIREAMREKLEYLRETCDDIGAHGERRRQIVGMAKDEYLDLRFEEYRDLSTARIAGTLGVTEPARYTVSCLGRIFPHALDGVTLVDPSLMRRVTQILEYEGEESKMSVVTRISGRPETVLP